MSTSKTFVPTTVHASGVKETFSEEDLGLDIAQAIVFADSKQESARPVRRNKGNKDVPFGTLVWTTTPGSESDASACAPADEGVTDIWIMPGISVSKETPSGLSHKDVTFLCDWITQAEESSTHGPRSYVASFDREEREDLHIFAAGVTLASRQEQTLDLVRTKSAESCASACSWELVDPWDYVDSWLLRETAGLKATPSQKGRASKARLSVEGITTAQKESHRRTILARQPAQPAPQPELVVAATKPSAAPEKAARSKFRAKLGRLWKKTKRAVGQVMAGAGEGISGDVGGVVLAC